MVILNVDKGVIYLGGVYVAGTITLGKILIGFGVPEIS